MKDNNMVQSVDKKHLGSEKNYWEKYYESHREPNKPSPFAEFVSNELDSGTCLVELGCGNGRDSVYFHNERSITVFGVDQCEHEMTFLNSRYGKNELEFFAADFTNLETKFSNIDYIYSRFSLHAIDEAGEQRVMEWACRTLKPNGRFFIEVRSANDQLCGTGEKFSDNEFSTDHYRRFASLDDLADKLKSAGMVVEYSLESKGLAVYKDEDPTVIRLICVKK
jgi:tellurite methyltransferase